MNFLQKAPTAFGYFPSYSKWIFGLLFVAMAFYYQFDDILFYPPQSLHQWRQTDCLSITYNYYKLHASFFEPSVHYLGHTGDGKTVSDFPLIYYLVAQLWSIWGHHEFIYRALVLTLFFGGLLAVQLLVEDILKDSFVALFVSLMLFTSPTLVYYSNNFLMNIPAFSLALMGLYFFYKYHKTNKIGWFLAFASLYGLAGLLKISALLSFVAISIIFLLSGRLNVSFRNYHLFKLTPLKLTVLVLVIFIQISWYLWAFHYNKAHNSGIFLIGILPLWEMSVSDIALTLEFIREHIRTDYYREYTQVVLLAVFVFNSLHYKHLSFFWKWFNALLTGGFVLYIGLFFFALKNHDYYVINLFILVPVVLVTFFIVLKKKYPPIFSSLLFRLILVLVLVSNIGFAAEKITERYHKNSWQNKEYITFNKIFTTIPPFLRELHIKPTDKVLSLSDNSINISLYLMQQRGWTNFGVNLDSMKIRQKINAGAKYLLLNHRDSTALQKTWPFISHKMAKFGNVDIYSLKE